MDEQERPPCRLFVVMASESPTAVVIRRGPAAWTQIIQWSTDNDKFTDGAWFKGRIYGEKCDLSPDGKLFVYFCHKGSRVFTEFTDSWTAISRLPWLHALALWPAGTTYGGGGRFSSNNELELRGSTETHPDFPEGKLKLRSANPPLHTSAELVEGAEWSGYDQSGRVVYTRGGQLYAIKGKQHKLLADFNSREPDPQEAPDWAKSPLR